MKEREIQVLYIITKLELGGAQKICLSLFKELQNHDYKSLLISGNEGILISEISNNPDVYLFDSFKREISLSHFLIEIKNFIRLIHSIRMMKKKYPALIIHTHSTKAGLLGRWAGFFSRVPIRIHTVHGFGFHPYQSKVGWLINFVFEFLTSFITTHYICVSSYDAKLGTQLLPFFKKKHSIIRAAVDCNTFKAALPLEKKKNAPFTFGTVACFKKQKNLFDLLHAFKVCNTEHPNSKLEIIGDGHLRKSLEAWILKNNLEKKIILHGWQNNVQSFMIQWDAFVLSSLWEGLPCAVVEARLLKLPVISYDTGGIHDVIDHRVNGLLCPPEKINVLASHMKMIMHEPNLYKMLHDFNDNLSEFDTTAMVNRHLELYQNLVTR